MKTIEHDGYTFSVVTERDEDAQAPWEDCGHGPVSEWTAHGKKPGELVLSVDGGHRRYYDFAEACETARRDGWSSPDVLESDSPRVRAAKAARADFEFLKSWCDDKWQYQAVVVTLLDVEGNETDAQQYMGRVDDIGSHVEETAAELAGDCLHDVADRLEFDDAGGTTYRSGSRSWLIARGLA